MVKKILVIIIALSLLIVPYTVFADTSSEHTHDFSGNAISFGLDVDGISVQFTETSCIESSCTYVKYDADFLVFHFSYVSDTHLSPDEVSKKFWEWRLKQLGKDNSLDKMDSTNAGANIPAAGGRNPKGYGDEGKADITVSGVGVVWAEPFGISSVSYNGFTTTAPSTLLAGSSQSGINWPYIGSNANLIYTFTAPVTGLYYVGSLGDPYDYGTFSVFYQNNWYLTYLTPSYGNYYRYSLSLSEGQFCYFSPVGISVKHLGNGRAYKYYLNKIPIYIEPLGDSSITTTNNITINNNTWNGNIYTDNSTNLTYIYPQYTTINEKNETVTNISNTPIIYNNETKQYYTYDETTKNYYYITYVTTPTPTPSPVPEPSSTPNPSITPSSTPLPGGSGTGGGDVSTPETGKPGGSSGSSWWDKLLSKIGDAIIDGLLGAVSAVLKLIFKLLSTILSWIIWAVSRVFDLLPFLPPGLGGLLVGGVVVCFVIGIIKFIRG